MTNAQLKRYPSIAAIKKANRDAGQHFFERSTMDFFGSIVMQGPIKGRFFVTSEQRPVDPDEEPEPRKYSVREARSDGSITTRGDFQQFTQPGEAVEFAASLDPSDD